MKENEAFFPYFLMMVAIITGTIAAYAPSGPGQNVMIGIATGASGGSLTAYGLPFAQKREDPPP